ATCGERRARRVPDLLLDAGESLPLERRIDLQQLVQGYGYDVVGAQSTQWRLRILRGLRDEPVAQRLARGLPRGRNAGDGHRPSANGEGGKSTARISSSGARFVSRSGVVPGRRWKSPMGMRRSPRGPRT